MKPLGQARIHQNLVSNKRPSVDRLSPKHQLNQVTPDTKMTLLLANCRKTPRQRRQINRRDDEEPPRDVYAEIQSSATRATHQTQPKPLSTTQAHQCTDGNTERACQKRPPTGSHEYNGSKMTGSFDRSTVSQAAIAYTEMTK